MLCGLLSRLTKQISLKRNIFIENINTHEIYASRRDELLSKVVKIYLNSNVLGKIKWYEGVQESIQPFWISREPVAWPWCNLVANQKRPYCAVVNSHSPVGLVIRQWDAVDRACVLCDRCIHKSSFFQRAILALGKATSHREPNLGCRGADRPGWCDVLPSLHESCRMGRGIVVMKLICSLGHCKCDGHTVHKLSQRRLTAGWLAPRESDCSRMHSEVSSDWLPSYIKTTQSVLEIFKMTGYCPDRSSYLYSNEIKFVLSNFGRKCI